jgi:hypothetical protein
MARHVFQYERMDTQLGLFLGDPSALPPLRPTEEQQRLAAAAPGGVFERPALADEAGLLRHTRGAGMNTGRAHRQQLLEERQRREILQEGAGGDRGGGGAPVPATAEAVGSASSSSPVMATARVVR